MDSRPSKIVGVYNANGGLLGEMAYVLGHAIGVRNCALCDITHSPIKKKKDFKSLEKSVAQEFGLGFSLVHKNERSQAQLLASNGREPCVLLEYSDGSYSMLLDWVELKSVSGKVSSFEKLLRSRLDFFL